jgi:hypothetical protein
VVASVLNIEEVPSQYQDDDGKIKNQFQWDFVVTEEGPFKGRRIRSWTTTSFTAHPNCKAYMWSKAIMRKDFREGESFDTDELISQGCRLVIGLTNDGKWNRVENVLPSRANTSVSTSDSAQEAPF